MMISSVDNNKIKEIRKLKQTKYSKEKELFIVETEHLVNEAYNAGILIEVIKLESNLNCYDVKETLVTENVMKTLTSMPSIPSVIGICSYIEEKKDLGNKIVILDNVQDPGNIGTIIRTAVAFNYNTIVLSSNSVNKYNEKVIRASQGMLFNINIIERNLLMFIPDLKKQGYDVYGTNVVNGIDVRDVNKTNKHAFILGNEGNGVSKEIEKLVDKNIYIDINSDCESLNVGIAGAIIMYEMEK